MLLLLVLMMRLKTVAVKFPLLAVVVGPKHSPHGQCRFLFAQCWYLLLPPPASSLFRNHHYLCQRLLHRLRYCRFYRSHV